jgi:hypothetical protein
MRSQTPFLTEKKRICDRKFVRSSDIGRVASGRKYLELTVSLIHMTSFSLYFFQKFGDETDADFGGAYISLLPDELRSNPIVARSPSLTGELHANRKIEIPSAQS